MDTNSLYRRAVELHQAGRLQEAAPIYEKLIKESPGDAQLLGRMGTLLIQAGNLDAAVDCLGASLRISPHQIEVVCHLGIAKSRQGKLPEALAFYDHAIALAPDVAEVHNNRGLVLARLGSHEQARLAFVRAIELRRNFAEAYYNCGNVLYQAGLIEESIRYFRQAVSIRPDLAEAWVNLGNALCDQRQFDAALEGYRKAVLLRPKHAETYANLASVLTTTGQFDLALENLDRALSISPHSIVALEGKANLLRILRRYRESLPCFDAVTALDQTRPFHEGNRLHAQMMICEWHDLDSRRERLVDRIEHGRPVSPPFAILALVDSPEIQKQCAVTYSSTRYPRIKAPDFPSDVRSNRAKIRVGYFSADFHDHATLHLMMEMIEQHNRDRFEIFAFSFGPESTDVWRKRALLAFDEFIDVRNASDSMIAYKARLMGMDIAVDLKGYTHDARPGVFSERAAPVQISYLGYPGTMAMEAMDYLIADRVVVPSELRYGYTESIIFMPDSYQVNCAHRTVSEVRVSRAKFGLPEGGFVFCCFNNAYKITPAIFDVWMGILREVGDSVLWLLVRDEDARNNLRTEARRRGVSDTRVVFAERVPVEAHLARLQLADLFLDTTPCNAHTTASDAIRMRVPVLTCIGSSFAGRVAASLLHAVGLPELIAKNLDDYRQLAVDLARSPARLSAIRIRLDKNLQTSSLFEPATFARRLEFAFETVFERRQRGLRPEDIFVGNT